MIPRTFDFIVRLLGIALLVFGSGQPLPPIRRSCRAPRT